MELKKSIFSRLFGSKAEDTPAEEEESFLYMVLPVRLKNS